MPSGRQAVTDILLLTLGAFLYTIASPPYEWASAGWLALTPLFLVLRNKTPRTAFLPGFLYGVLFGAGIAYWAYFSIAAYFPFPFPLDLLFTFLSVGFSIGPYTGLAASLSCMLMRSRRPFLRWGGIPALWVSNELARSYLFFGFCWELLGHTQYRHLPLIQIADITGVYGLSFLMALSGYVAAETLVSLHRCWQAKKIDIRLPWPALGALAVGITLVLLYGTIRLRHNPSTASRPSLRVALVQGNVPSGQRWKRVHYASTLLKYVSITRRGINGAQPDLIVWPEFAVGFYLDREPLLRAQLGRLTHRVKAPLLLGAPRMEDSAEGKRYYNSAYLIAPGGEILDVYDKIRLIPFAEYRPLVLPALLDHSPEQPNEFTAGKRSTIFSFPPKGAPKGAFGAMICYEATYPYLARRLVWDGAQFLVNISNDTWLVAGGEAAAAQHFSIAVFRAVENRRYLVRTATAGISGFVDPTGRPYHLSAEEEGVILGEVLPRQQITVYTKYGDWFALACTSFALVALIVGAKQQL
jgi:apolipoprotein N-acyltransferase